MATLIPPTAIKVVVKRSDLKGRYSNNIDCPIARAVKRQFPEENVFVSSNCLWIGPYRYSIPVEANSLALVRAGGDFFQRLFWGGFKFTIRRD